MPVESDDQNPQSKINTLEDLSLFLFDLANTIHEHRDMLFRLSDEAKAEADKLRGQGAGASG